MAIQENGSSVLYGNRNQNVFKREIKSTVMVSILLGFYTLSWLPVIIYFFVSVSCNGCHINHYIRASVRILLYLNSAVNVFIYAGRLSDFRIFFLRYWRRCCKGLNREHRKQKPGILPSVTAIVNSYTSTKRPHHDYHDRIGETSLL
ncbi:hypothetical protein CHS0354_002505 [Potamilus streckersoni]|uniref:G-protein coupled receptors family 1 profile domain-containing protein n=1 Tax=Potamilus streckersoni TaxID=2493646 RepID=A0AAE0VZZ0_9BIVA|nr:hypothetical protein CHS0354_002505 [Potamilus streckersoni]